MHPHHSLLPGIPLIESPLFPTATDTFGADDDARQIAGSLRSNGYAIVTFPELDFDVVAARVKEQLAAELDLEGWRRDGWSRNADVRIQDAWTRAPDVRRLAVNARILEILSLAYGRRAFPFRTQNFAVGMHQP